MTIAESVAGSMSLLSRLPKQRVADHPEMMRTRRATVEHPFGTLKAWMGSTHFLTKTLEKTSTEMSLHVLAYNMKRVMNILGVEVLIEAITALFVAYMSIMAPYAVPDAFPKAPCYTSTKIRDM